MTAPFTHGQEVIVLDRKGEYEFRGKVMGVHRSNPWRFDVQPRAEESLAKRVCGIPADRLRGVGRPYLAYERGDNEPRMVKDDA